MNEMKLNRKRTALGVATLGLAGALAAGVGVGVAQAASGPSTRAPGPASTATPPYGPGMHGMMAGQNAPIAAAASYLGLSQSDLQSQLRSGKTLADVAKAQGKSVSGLKDAMLAAIKSNLDANTTLTSEQKTAILTLAKSRIDTMINATHSPGSGPGPMGGPMRGMWR